MWILTLVFSPTTRIALKTPREAYRNSENYPSNSKGRQCFWSPSVFGPFSQLHNLFVRTTCSSPLSLRSSSRRRPFPVAVTGSSTAPAGHTSFPHENTSPGRQTLSQSDAVHVFCPFTVNGDRGAATECIGRTSVNFRWNSTARA